MPSRSLPFWQLFKSPRRPDASHSAASLIVILTIGLGLTLGVVGHTCRAALGYGEKGQVMDSEGTEGVGSRRMRATPTPRRQLGNQILPRWERLYWLDFQLPAHP